MILHSDTESLIWKRVHEIWQAQGVVAKWMFMQLTIYRGSSYRYHGSSYMQDISPGTHTISISSEALAVTN